MIMNKQFEIIIEWGKENLTFNQLNRLKECIEENDIEGMWGYLLKFFDSVGIIIECDKDGFDIVKKGKYLHETDSIFKTRTEAQQAAIKKAFEILTQDKNR